MANTSTTFNEFAYVPVHDYEYSNGYAWDADSETTGFFGLNGAATDYVIHKKGYANGKAIVNGLSSEAGHAYTVAEGFCDATGADADLMLSGNWAKNATKKALKAAFAGEVFTYVENFTTDVGHINVCGPKGSKAFPWVLDTCPKKEWDAKAAAEALACQVKTFGEFYCFGIKNAKTSKKYELKMAALSKSLDSAFGSQVSYSELFFDTNEEKSWYPKAADPMDALIEEEENETSWESVMAKAKAAMTTDEWAMVIDKANGMGQAEIAEKYGYCNNGGVSKKLKAIAKKATKAAGVAFVAT